MDDRGLPSGDVHGTFGGGEHACVGLNLARVGSCLAVASIVSRYDMKFVSGPPSMKERFDVGPVPIEGDIRVRFLPRS